MLLQRSLFAFLAVSLVVVAGCGEDGPALSPVTGKVTKGGQPVEKVLVTFSPESGKGISSTGQTGADGRFILISQTGKAGAPVGTYKVTITSIDSGGNAGGGTGPTDWSKMAADRDAAMRSGKDGAPAAKAKEDKVPPEYADPGKTPFKYEVKAGNNDFDLPIP
ncbi:MAG: carboxypeptidase regulatory-like domain-containing protein [Planctomycetes bacterium]|nr:carboxypeptidase regulatory-like domain-containing protein [Planctomycetota bacterium]